MGADSNRRSLVYKVESSYGVVPSGNPTLKTVRMVNETLKQNAGTVSSQELRADRRRSDLIRTSLSAGGQVDFEFSYGAYDEWLAAALMSDETGALGWVATSAPVTSDTSISFQANADSASAWPEIDDSANGLAAYPVGSVIVISGSTSNNVAAIVRTSAAGTLGVQPLNATGDLTTETAGASVTITIAEYCRDGVLQRSFSIERKYGDLSNEFAQFPGCMMAGFRLGVDTDGILTGQFTILGKREQSASATFGDGSPTAAPTNDVMNSIDNVSAVIEGTAASAPLGITELSIELDNNLRARPQVGTLGAISIGAGTVDVKGKLQTYYSSKTIFDKWLNHTTTGLAFMLTDSAGQRYVVVMPRVKFSDGGRAGGGINTDVFMDLDYEALVDSSAGYTIQISRLP